MNYGDVYIVVTTQPVQISHALLSHPDFTETAYTLIPSLSQYQNSYVLQIPG